MKRSLKGLLIVIMAGVIALGMPGCGSAPPETVGAAETEAVVPVEAAPAVETPADTKESSMGSYVPDYLRPLTEGPWPALIVVGEDEILFATTGERIPYNPPWNPRTSGEVEDYRSEYEIPLCLPNGKGLALFRVTVGCDWSGADIEFYDPDGRLLSKLEGSNAWPYFCPDGERFIHYVMYGNDDTDAYLGGVQLRGIDGTIFFDVRIEQALAIIEGAAGKAHSQGRFFTPDGSEPHVFWDQSWNYFAFGLWGDNAEPEPSSLYLFIYSAQGNLVRFLAIEDNDGSGFDGARFDQSIDAQFAELGVVRGN